MLQDTFHFMTKMIHKRKCTSQSLDHVFQLWLNCKAHVLLQDQYFSFGFSNDCRRLICSCWMKLSGIAMLSYFEIKAT